MDFTSLGIGAAERGLLPDAVVRRVIRRFCRQRLRQLEEPPPLSMQHSWHEFAKSLTSGPIALEPELANEQHYELSPDFFAAILGPHRKYSCCYFEHAETTITEAEEAALSKTAERAELTDGQEILELGCGWGSLSLWIAERFPHSRITAVSNSTSQKKAIEELALARSLTNLNVITADMNHFSPGTRRFDRIVSVEMFEHMRNYRTLLQRISTWLKPEGKLFVHIFCHRTKMYPFEVRGQSDWMSRYFFSGGMMPSADLIGKFTDHLHVTKHYAWSGLHYQRTADAWLASMDANRDRLLPILQLTYGPRTAERWFQRWRMFFLAVSELFGFAGGSEWFVSHYLLEHAQTANKSVPLDR